MQLKKMINLSALVGALLFGSEVRKIVKTQLIFYTLIFAIANKV